MEIKTIDAQPRPKTGKGVGRRLRAQDLIPAICYGRGRAPQAVAISPRDLTKALDPQRGWNTVLRLKVGDGGEESLVMVRDYQVDPIKRSFVHVDFLAISEEEPVQVEIPLSLAGKAEGVKEGGILQQVRRTIAVRARPFDIPAQLSVDVTNLKLGQALHLSDIAFPAGVTSSLDPRTTICNIVSPKEEKAATEEVAADAALAAAATPAATPAAAAPAAKAPAAKGGK